jgi:hypothetical protein
VDLNWSSTSGLPVFATLKDNDGVLELNSSTLPTVINIKKPGKAVLEVTQPGDLGAGFNPAPKIQKDLSVFKKELIVRVENKFRKPDEANPLLTYTIEGFVNDDNESVFDQNISLLVDLDDGSVENPSMSGDYTIRANGAISEYYFFTYIDGLLTVSDKAQQEIVFDQNLAEGIVVGDEIDLTGKSFDLRTEQETLLPLYYELEDSSIAQFEITRADELVSHWKLDESRYAEASDDLKKNSGNLRNLITSGPESAWKSGKFSNSLLLNNGSALVDFGPLQVDGNFSFSLWIKPDSNVTSGAEMGILSKTGSQSMNYFRVFKPDGNGSVSVEFYPDGSNPVLITSENEVFTDGNWTHLMFSYNQASESFKLFADAQLVAQANNLARPSESVPFEFRFTNLILGDYENSFIGYIDDLRYYNIPLSFEEVIAIFNHGGGDYQKLRIVGAGKTRITAYQNGNDDFEKSIPVTNYLTASPSPQTISFTPILDRSVGDFPFRLEATSSSGLPIAFTVSDLALASLKGDMLTLRNAGSLSITASQDGNAQYLSADPVTRSFTIHYGNLFAESVKGLALWLDGNDINNDLVEDRANDFIGDEKVSLWADKSGNNNSPIQATSPQMPIWREKILSGISAVEFSMELNSSLSLQYPIQPAVIFLVAKQNTMHQSIPFGGDIELTTNNGFWALGYNSGNPLIRSAYPSSQWSILSVSFYSDSQYFWVNGHLVGTQNQQVSPQEISDIGHNFNGQIAELLVYENPVNLINRQKIEGYLAHKWKLNDRLPPLHKYASDTPSFGGQQDITWLEVEVDQITLETQIPVKALSDEDFELKAVASSGLDVVFQSSNTNVLKITGNKATITGTGTTLVTAYQNGDTRFFPADPQTVSLRVINFSDPLFRKDNQTIEVQSIPLKVRDDPPFQVLAYAQSSGENHPVYELPVSLSITSGPATIDSRGVVTLDGIPGTVTVGIEQGGNAFVNKAETELISFEVSSLTRPKVIFSDPNVNQTLNPLFLSDRLQTIPNVYSSNETPLVIESSSKDVISVFRGNQLIAKNFGTTVLTFTTQPKSGFAPSDPISKTITVMPPTRNAWIENRKQDPRYENIKSRFIDKVMQKSEHLSEEIAATQFDEDYADSDGDGYSNLFERAMGMDSLGPDHIDSFVTTIDSNQLQSTISFVQFRDSLSTLGEEIKYQVEASSDLKSWTSDGVKLDSSIPQSGLRERVFYRFNPYNNFPQT